MEMVRRVLMVVSIVLLVVDAVIYLQRYYTDNCFRNKHLSRRTLQYWKTRDYYKSSLHSYLSSGWDGENGLRHWEMKSGYKMLDFPTCSLRLSSKILRKSISVCVFTVFTCFVLLADHVLASLLDHIKHDEKFHISLAGFHRDISPGVSARLQEDFNTKTCLSTPKHTNNNTICLIVFLIMVASFSCLLQVFLAGVRAKICDFFYPDRARERADYLYFELLTGRVKRKSELLMLVRREVERREKLLNFSPYQRLKEFILFALLRSRVSCTGCKRRVEESKMRRISLEGVGRTGGELICVDCELDLSSKYKIMKSSPMFNY